jgi:hypothetical protein
MKEPVHVALVSEVEEIDASDLNRVSAALQRQVTRDFAPIWNVEATVDAFGRLEDVPLGYWPVVVKREIGESALGYHQDRNGQPYALVLYSQSWSLTASHEILEMLGDPWGNNLVGGTSIKEDQGRVRYLVEVCDPCEAPEFAYRINGVLVSDFYTPAFFDSRQSSGGRYDFTRAIPTPKTVLRGGYISWIDTATDHVWQQVWSSGDATPHFRDLTDKFGSHLQSATRSLREFVDRVSVLPEVQQGVPEGDESLEQARSDWHEGKEASAAWAQSFREELDSVIEGAGEGEATTT